jgi:hypothetical protein
MRARQLTITATATPCSKTLKLKVSVNLGRTRNAIGTARAEAMAGAACVFNLDHLHPTTRDGSADLDWITISALECDCSRRHGTG